MIFAMKITIHAVGRMKSGPETELAGRYLDRFARSGGVLGFDFCGVTEIAESRLPSAAERMREEASRLTAAFGEGPALILLDERGKALSSRLFADLLARLRDEGCRHAVLAVGGPDGHADSLRARAATMLSFGAMTWPHQLVRVMLAEQLYRAATILSNHPYHRD
jgi:23S rRNA (pseudouridine1915-N3)-methyltransferase